jgi:hypothetical protein
MGDYHFIVWRYGMSIYRATEILYTLGVFRIPNLHSLFRKLYYLQRSIFITYLNLFLPRLFRLALIEANSYSSIRKVWSFLTDQVSDIDMTRVGGNNDGGYFCPTDLSSITTVFSPGYGGIKDFEDELGRLGKKIYICDPMYDHIPNLMESQDFDGIGLAATSNADGLFLSLSDWIDSKVDSNTNHMLLQMDIEGAEWEILLHSEAEVLRRFDVLLIEFHNLDRLVFDKNFLESAEILFAKLANDFTNIYCRANNCGGTFAYLLNKMPKVVEITLVKNSQLELWRTLNPRQPINDEDFSNNPSLPSLKLPSLS